MLTLRKICLNRAINLALNRREKRSGPPEGQAPSQYQRRSGPQVPRGKFCDSKFGDSQYMFTTTDDIAFFVAETVTQRIYI